MKTLENFPQFTVTSVQLNDKEIRIFGSFNDSKSVSERRSWLVSGQECYIGDLCDFRPIEKTAAFINWEKESRSIQQGATFAWIDGYWNWNLLSCILDKTKTWEKEKFQFKDAQMFIQNGVKGWCEVGKKIPENAKVGEIVKDGWDHEHCEICNAKIGKGGESDCYKNARFWLCVNCFNKYASSHDLSFTDDF